MTTADTITDDQIRELRDDNRLHSADRKQARIALDDRRTLTTPRMVRAARVRCAEILNARK